MRVEYFALEMFYKIDLDSVIIIIYSVYLFSGDCQEKIALVDSPVPINSDEEEYSNDSDYSRQAIFLHMSKYIV